MCNSEMRGRQQILDLVQSRSYLASKALITQERFWELKDLIVELTDYDIKGAWFNVFFTSFGNETSPRVLIEDCTSGVYDE